MKGSSEIMNNADEKRLGNLDVLRILATTGVIILHINSFSIGGLLDSSAFLSTNSLLAYTGESIFASAVNVFLIISGFFLSQRKCIKLSKALKLLLEVSAISIAVYLATVVLKRNTFTLSGFITHVLPVNYYVILYSALFLFSPLINSLIDITATKHKLKMFVSAYLSIFILWPFFVSLMESYSDLKLAGLSTIGIEGDMGGYTIINFMGMYLIGATIRKSGYRLRSAYCLGGLLSCWAAITIWKLFEDTHNITSISLDYNNPLIVLSSLLSVLLFLNLNIKTNKIINIMAKASFIVYLIQGYFLHFINAIPYANSVTPLLISRILIIIIVIWLIAIPLNMVFELFFGHLKNTNFVKRIDDMGKIISLEE